MVLCKHCGSERSVRNGQVKDKQRYLCKSCGQTFREGDNRVRYSIEQHIRVIKLYTENVGLRSIERLEGIPAPLLVRWIRSFGKVLREKLCTTEVPQDAKDIVILELDELYTYYQKKVKEPTYGLLWTATGIKLLIL